MREASYSSLSTPFFVASDFSVAAWLAAILVILKLRTLPIIPNARSSQRYGRGTWRSAHGVEFYKDDAAFMDGFARVASSAFGINNSAKPQCRQTNRDGNIHSNLDYRYQAICVCVRLKRTRSQLTLGRDYGNLRSKLQLNHHGNAAVNLKEHRRLFVEITYSNSGIQFRRN